MYYIASKLLPDQCKALKQQHTVMRDVQVWALQSMILSAKGMASSIREVCELTWCRETGYW
jgi:hypothetical protein